MSQEENLGGQHKAKSRDLHPVNIIKVIASLRQEWACKVVGLAKEPITLKIKN